MLFFCLLDLPSCKLVPKVYTETVLHNKVGKTILEKEHVMNLQLTGHHLEITPALRDYLHSKLSRISNHFDHVIDMKVTMSVEKFAQKVEATLHVPGNDLHAECIDENMYSAIDMLTDKLDRQVLKHKEKQGNHHKTNGAVKHQAAN
jgi:putative sigma-54 modulation protein